MFKQTAGLIKLNDRAKVLGIKSQGSVSREKIHGPSEKKKR